MSERAWRFITTMLTALSAAMAFAHLLELPPKMRYEARLYVTVQKSLYQLSGTIGAVFEVGAVLSSPLLAYRVRQRQPDFTLSVVAALCMIVSHALYWLLVEPVNATMRGWSADAVPTDWTRLRKQWELTHAARAILMLFGLGALVASNVLEMPAETRPAHLHEMYDSAA